MNVLAKSLKKNQEYMKSLVDNGFFFYFILFNQSFNNFKK
jgi:hypothetical protein